MSRLCEIPLQNNASHAQVPQALARARLHLPILFTAPEGLLFYAWIRAQKIGAAENMPQQPKCNAGETESQR